MSLLISISNVEQFYIIFYHYLHFFFKKSLKITWFSYLRYGPGTSFKLIHFIYCYEIIQHSKGTCVSSWALSLKKKKKKEWCLNINKILTSVQNKQIIKLTNCYTLLVMSFFPLLNCLGISAHQSLVCFSYKH